MINTSALNKYRKYIDELIKFLKWRLPNNNQQQPSDEQEIILFEWYKNKNIYEFDSALSSIFPDTMNLSVRDIAVAITSMPFTCIFVADNLMMYASPYEQIKALGFWAAMNYEKPLHELRLMYFLDDRDTYIMKIPLDANLTVKQCIALGRGSIDATSRGGRISNEEYAERFESIVVATLQRLCFICSQNAVKNFSDEKSRSITRKLQIENNIGVWNVGVRYSHDVTNQLPINSDVDENDTLDDNHLNNGTEKTRSRPRPHVRRAHWRRCWVGSTSDSTGRKLVIKWIPQSCVNKKDATQMPLVIHLSDDT